MPLFRVIFAVIPGVLLVFAATSSAAPVTYTYTGNDFGPLNYGVPFLSYSDFISGSITFASALPDDLAYSDQSSAVLDWTFTDQVNTLSQAGGDYFDQMWFATDASGDIIQWEVQVVRQNVFAIEPDIPTFFNTINIPSVQEQDLTNYSQSFYNSNDPGVWTESTPEPSTAMMASLGAAIPLFAVMRRKSSR